ncbi:HAD family hydrolase [Halobium salinum]|uniref:HAD family hydrolase n=1 Tax=Halobium salinum TaxID=1364940 RepID=A0ABD5PCG3_9EURY|nr:HAD family hydrolase [Halobium salinum]
MGGNNTIRCGGSVATNQYRAVLFDSDGVLVERPDRQRLAAAVARAFAAFDLPDPSAADVRALLAGNVDVFEPRCRRNGVDLRTFCRRTVREVVRTQCGAFDRGVRSLYDDAGALHTLARRGLALGVVTNNHRRVVSVALRQSTLADRFEVVRGADFSPDGVRERKPSPHNLTAALATLDVDPSEALYVGDSDVDVLAAERAGVDSAFVRRSHRADYDLPVEPTYEVESLEALPTLLDGTEPDAASAAPALGRRFEVAAGRVRVHPSGAGRPDQGRVAAPPGTSLGTD